MPAGQMKLPGIDLQNFALKTFPNFTENFIPVLFRYEFCKIFQNNSFIQ